MLKIQKVFSSFIFSKVKCGESYNLSELNRDCNIT